MPSPSPPQPKTSQTSRPARRRKPPLAVLAGVVLLAALLPHLKSLGYGFVWDDQVMIGPQLDLTGPGDLIRLWRTPFDSLLRDPMLHNTYFRPLSILSLAADRALYASSPAGFHLTNLALYGSACLFLWLFAAELSGRPALAAAGTCVFALHPTHPESVDFIAGRTDLLCGLFLFASLWAAVRFGPRIASVRLKLLPSAALLLLALLSKEVAFFAAPLPLVALWVRDRTLRPATLARASLPILGVLLLAGAARLWVLGTPGLPSATPVEGAVPQLLTSVALTARYLALLLVPVGLSARHEIAPLTRPDLLFAAGCLVLLAAVAGAWLLLRRRSLWSLPLLLFALTLVPLCAARLIAGALLAERFLFIPSASIALSIALLPASAGALLAAVAAPVYLILLLPRVSIWKDDFTLYSSMLRDSPNSAYVHAVLGSYYYQARDLPRAIQHHRRAFELKPEFNESLLNLSAAEDEAGQPDSALAHVRLLLRLRPGYAAAWYELGNIQVHAARPDSAAAAYGRALRVDPRFAAAENNLGVVLERMGRTEEAIAHYRRAEQIQPGYVDAANNLARLGVKDRP